MTDNPIIIAANAIAPMEVFDVETTGSTPGLDPRFRAGELDLSLRISTSSA
jgi:hypothetical protein